MTLLRPPPKGYQPPMTLPHALSGLSDIAADYDLLLCDVWGVIHNGRESWPEACAALTRFNRDHGKVVLISNSPRPAPGMIQQMDQLGVPRDSWGAVVTSGDATRVELGKRAPGPAWIIGPDRDWPLYEGLGLDVAGFIRSFEECLAVVVASTSDDQAIELDPELLPEIHLSPPPQS